MKDKIIIFIIGILVGAVIATGSFYIYLNTSKCNNNNNQNQMNGGQPPEMPNGQNGQKPEMPNNSTQDNNTQNNNNQSNS